MITKKTMLRMVHGRPAQEGRDGGLIAQLRRGALEYCVLALLERRERYGFDLVRELFFLQAEDGIRDLYVTVVQTCALPIERSGSFSAASNGASRSGIRVAGTAAASSEERRVGKECRSRWSPYHYKNKG